MPEIPADAPRSEDGAYWWNGSEWKSVAESSSTSFSGGYSHEIPADAPRSEDGGYWWDGSAWQPVGGDSSDTAAADASHAPSSNTFQIDPGEFTALARLVYFVQAGDPDGYLADLGIDPSEMDTDDPAIA